MRFTRKIFRGVLKVNDAINAASNEIAAVMIMVVMFLTSADIIGRYFFNKPVMGAYEITLGLMVFIVFLAFAYTQRVGANMRALILVSRLPKNLQTALNVFALLAGAFIFGIITYMGWGYAMGSFHAREFMTGSLALPLYPIKIAVPVGAGLTCLQFILDAIKVVSPQDDG